MSYAERAYDAGRSGIALPYLQSVISDLTEASPAIDRRRLLMVEGVLLYDTGRWCEALRSLEQAKKIALEVGDESGYFFTQSNTISTYFLRGEYQRVLNLTDPPRLPPNTCEAFSKTRCAYLLNRASAAVALRIGSIAIEAGYEAIELSAAAGKIPNLLHDAIARHMLIRGLLLAKDVTRAEAVLANAFLPTAAQPRATIQLHLAEGAIAIHQFKWRRASDLIDSVLASSTAAASKRDALMLKISLQEAANDSAGLLATLGLLSDEVVAHRSSVMKDSLSLHELVAPVLHNLSDAESFRPTSEVTEQLVRILSGSESEEDHANRWRVAELSRKFAEQLGFGTPYCKQIERAASLRDLGKFATLATKTEAPSPATSMLLGLEVESTAKLLKQCGFDEESLEIKCALQRFERTDGSGLLGIRGEQFCREAQIVSICQHYVAEVSRAEHSDAAHRGFVARAMYASGRWYSTEITAQFATFVEPLWRSKHFIKDTSSMMDETARGHESAQ